MADTIGSLIEDIEKRMVDLGYEDFELLAGPDHDLKSLKELKRQLMNEKKQRQLEKKEKTKNTNGLRDLLVKISKVFRKDFYIYNGIYIIPGELSKDNLKGSYLLRLQDEFSVYMKKILFKEPVNTIIFVSDISLLKGVIDENICDESKVLQEALDKNIIRVEDKDSYNEIYTFLKEEIKSIEKDSNDFISCEINVDDDPEIISRKKLFLIQYKNLPPIEGNIQLFPFFTEKEETPIEFMTNIMEESENMNIYYGRFHITYSYFDIYIKLTYF